MSPLSLLVGTAGQAGRAHPAAARARARFGGSSWCPLADEFPLRYQDWVADRRAYVHAQTDGKVGYLHVPT